MTTALRNDRAATKPMTTTNAPATTNAATTKAMTTEDADVIALPTKKAASDNRLADGAVQTLRSEIAALAKTKMGETEADEIVARLAKLPASDFREVMGQIAADPKKLNALLDNASAPVGDALVQLMLKKGLIAAAPTSTPPTVGPKAPAPPAAPVLWKDDVNAPPALRQLILDHNLQAAEQYNDRYRTYRDAYLDAVDGATSVAELRALRPLAPSQLPDTLPGAPVQSDANRAYQEVRGTKTHDLDVATAVADRARRLAGHEIMGISVKAEAGVKTSEGPVKTVRKLGVEVGADGKVEGEAKREHEVEVEHHGHSVKSNGKGVSYEVEVGDEAAVGVAVGEDGIELNGKFLGVTGKATFNGDSMGFGIGYERSVSIGGEETEVEVGLEVHLQGADGEQSEALSGASDVGFFDAPAELAKGTSWSALSSSTRARYEQLGWTAEEWKNAADLARFSRAGR
jgi:hypothetical protein